MGNMSDNLIIQAFNTLFIYNMCEVLQDAYDVPPTLLSLFLGFSFVLNNFFLKNMVWQQEKGAVFTDWILAS